MQGADMDGREMRKHGVTKSECYLYIYEIVKAKTQQKKKKAKVKTKVKQQLNNEFKNENVAGQW